MFVMCRGTRTRRRFFEDDRKMKSAVSSYDDSDKTLTDVKGGCNIAFDPCYIAEQCSTIACYTQADGQSGCGDPCLEYCNSVLCNMPATLGSGCWNVTKVKNVKNVNVKKIGFLNKEKYVIVGHVDKLVSFTWFTLEYYEQSNANRAFHINHRFSLSDRLHIHWWSDACFIFLIIAPINGIKRL